MARDRTGSAYLATPAKPVQDAPTPSANGVAALVLGSVDLVLLPYGTALGCYALATLLREDAKRLFEVRA